ncbi:bifunctional diguanylate cyclase/phosphodiesterase [Sulfurihydrogenibium sp.]|uniref:putative bifunctional diguanylate cyclase/phosphodiesterase n=1 Tax=Sulfurihydrogenibium sp. TaxID=2053621 RepID=UPI002612D671|nr:bifunctional diguanylate cyclase/phosphodiesterase [Sulfurihydrogenibium sp.]
MVLKFLIYEIEKNKTSVLITLFSLIILGALYYLFPTYLQKINDIVVRKDLEKETVIAKNIIEKITDDTQEPLISKITNDKVYKDYTRLLEILNTPNTQYVYILYENGGRFYITLDASKEDRMKPLEILEPLESELPVMNNALKTNQPQYKIHENISTLGLTLYIPFKDKKGLTYILVIDYTIEKIKEIESLIKTLRNTVLITILVIVGLSVAALIGILKTLYYKKRSLTDKLTGVYNRNYLEEIDNRKNIQDYVVLLVDIDFFKKINDTYGHHVGDEVLKTVSSSIKSILRDDDVVIRYGGEEFLILVKKYRNADKLMYINIAERIRQRIEGLKIKINERDYIKTTLSIGVFLDTDKVKNLHEAIKKADVSLYKAKSKGRNRIEIYDEEIKSSEKAIKVSEIKDAIEERRLLCLYQPIVSLKDGKTSHYEALVRIKDREGNIVPPYKFLNIIENTFLYSQLTKEVIEYNLDILKKYPDIKVSINLKPSDILNRSTVDILLDISKQDATVKKMMLEIVETEDVLAYDEILKTIKELKESGYTICLDDFGSGYSNFVYLLRLNIDYLKIDANLIKNITTDRVSLEVVKMINEFCQKMNIKTVAEYVKNEEILKIVQSIGIDYGQGYYFSKPKPMENFLP